MYNKLVILFLSVIISCKNKTEHEPRNHKNDLSGHYEILENLPIDNRRCVLISDVLNSDSDILSNLLKIKFYGKVVYVDFWATWCRPCLEEIPNAKLLQSKYQDKDIVFLTFCCNSKLEDWKNIIVESQLNGEHHLLNNDQCYFLKEAYLLTSFPRYLIFNKQGKLVDAEAPRPRDPRLENILNQLIETNL